MLYKTYHHHCHSDLDVCSHDNGELQVARGHGVVVELNSARQVVLQCYVVHVTGYVGLVQHVEHYVDGGQIVVQLHDR